MKRMKSEYMKRVIFALLGNVFIGIGIGFFNVSTLGVDCYSALAVTLGAKLGLEFAAMLFVLNVICFILECMFGFKHIGVGTFFNLLCVGTIATASGNAILSIFHVTDSMVFMIVAMILGVLTMSLGISLYQQSEMGVAPYDSLSLMIFEKSPIPYFWCRIFTDGFCAAAAFFLGGQLGVGTLICAFGLGPFIQFFDKTVSKKIMNKQA